MKCPSFNGYGLLVFICMLFAFDGSESIKWDLKTKPLVFGEDVHLACDGSECQPNTTKKWIGGPSYQLLCFDGYSVNSSKYAILFNDNIADFGLVIKKIAVEDTYYIYTCACGLHQYTETLDLEGVDYIYPPDIHLNITVERDGKYQIDIQMNVYPFPTCFFIYEKSAIPVNITNSKLHIRGDNFKLYNVSIIHTIDICKGEIILTCNAGKRNYTQSIDFCKEKMATNVNFMIPLLMITISAFIVIILGYIFLYIKYRYRKQKLIRNKNVRKRNESYELNVMITDQGNESE